MKKTLTGSFFLLVLSYLPLQAQDHTVTGHVTASKDGSALPGVTITVKKSQNGTTTDAQGNYRLAVPGNPTLVFSAIGFASQEIVLGSRAVVNVELIASVKVSTHIYSQDNWLESLRIIN
ncbi:carboxypeptidase-like regulatory domain-containing protein [Spirosoma flavum]|uniref:Carboxypeptidase-like regulatory domain-containing protein n=1 Tax=Spirosoma flavum TaxID=2048557 RepID=A0ABW6ALZ6_9BACT